MNLLHSSFLNHIFSPFYYPFSSLLTAIFFIFFTENSSVWGLHDARLNFCTAIYFGKRQTPL